MPDGGMQHLIAIVDFGASNTTFSVLKDMRVIYTRDFSFGGQQLTEEIMRTYGLSLEDAGRAKKEGGLPGNYEPEVLVPFIDDMTQQVSRSLQFFLASGGGREQPDQILVCGGCANIAGVADMISSKVGIPTEIGDPLGSDEDLQQGEVPGNPAGRHRLADGVRACAAELRQKCLISICCPGGQNCGPSGATSSSSDWAHRWALPDWRCWPPTS